MDDLAEIATSAKPKPEALAEQVFAAIQDNGFGQYDGVIATLAPMLGERGLQHLKELVQSLSEEWTAPPSPGEEEVVGWGSAGPVSAHEVAASARRSTVSMALKDIADASGDVDGFVAQYDQKARRVPAIAAQIANRLLDAGRNEDALAALNAAETDGNRWIPREFHEARFRALDATGRGRRKEAQAARWQNFEHTLSVDDLRGYLKRLPDFDEIDAEEQALDHAKHHPNLLLALTFLLDWKAFDCATDLVMTRWKELDGNRYEILTLAADALSKNSPLAATRAYCAQ
ncbi:MAG: hypothetical protein AcusKO_42240 [Acuticoccus sp.]